MSRTDTIEALAKTLLPKGDILTYPDHPLVLKGPSLLSLVEGVLTASFVYTRASRPANSVTEQARLLLARLAFPGHTAFEAIFADDSMPDKFSLSLFDSYRIMTPRSLSKPDGDIDTQVRVASAVESLRRPHFARFAANQENKMTAHSLGTRASFSQFSLESMPNYKFVEPDFRSLRAEIPRGSWARTTSRIQRVAETFAASDYGLGRGTAAFIDVAGAIGDVLYLEQHAVGAQFSFRGERNGVEAGKPLRAAQFAGGMAKNPW